MSLYDAEQIVFNELCKDCVYKTKQLDYCLKGTCTAYSLMLEDLSTEDEEAKLILTKAW